MAPKRILATALALLMLGSPLATATWSVFGSHEPDTPYDSSAWMFPNPPSPGQKRVYFNAYSMMLSPPVIGVATVNPNVGALRTSNEVPHNEFHEAILGVWTDCNGDGYIGLAESAFHEYEARLLLDTSICPPSTGTPNSWNGANNYNGWVSELIPISRGDSTRDIRTIRDDATRVWGDFHRPDERPFQVSCALNPQPRGTYQSTGGFLNWIDCRGAQIFGPSNDLAANWNQVVATGGDPLDLTADGGDWTQSSLQRETAGTEDSNRSPIHFSDCDADELFVSGDFINGTGQRPLVNQLLGADSGRIDRAVVVHQPAPALGDTSNPTVPAAVNATNEETLGDCDYSNDRGADFYGILEDDFNGVDPNNKREADWNFDYNVANRGDAPWSLLHAGNAGQQGSGIGVGGAGSRWQSDSVWLSKPGPRTLKIDLGNGGVGVNDAYWLTFYAYVGANTTSRATLPGGAGTYGAWHCGGATSGIHRGWNCDASTWYINPDGTSPTDPPGELDLHELTYVHMPYNLRDVDCYDGSNDLGLPLGAAAFGQNPCP